MPSNIADNKMPGICVTQVVELPVWVPEAMEPGCVFLLTNRFELRTQRELHSFWAVLACPLCGTLGLITAQQYWGLESVLCGSHQCGCHFLIEAESLFRYLPAQ